MGAQLRSVCVFLLLLLTLQEMMPSEAAVCQAPSRLFHGPCFSSRNCLAICEKDGFVSGACKRLKCVCTKDCKSGGEEPGEGPPGQGGDEPGEGPPGQGGDEPGEGPPGQGGDEPGEGPPGQGGDEPGEGPPGQGGEEPGEGPPGQGGDEPGEGPPEEGGDDGEGPVAHPPKKPGGRAKPPVHSTRYLLLSN